MDQVEVRLAPTGAFPVDHPRQPVSGNDQVFRMEVLMEEPGTRRAPQGRQKLPGGVEGRGGGPAVRFGPEFGGRPGELFQGLAVAFGPILDLALQRGDVEPDLVPGTPADVEGFEEVPGTRVITR